MAMIKLKLSDDDDICGIS